MISAVIFSSCFCMINSCDHCFSCGKTIPLVSRRHVSCGSCGQSFHTSCILKSDTCPACQNSHGILYICTGFLTWIICNEQEVAEYLEFLNKRAHIVARIAAEMVKEQGKVRIAFPIMPGKLINIRMKHNGIFNLALEFEVLRERLSVFERLSYV